VAAGWVNGLFVAAAVVTAVSVLVAKAVVPMWRFARRADKLVPLLAKLADQLEHQPDHGQILAEIVKQVRTNGGSSLLDIITDIKAQATANAASNAAVLSLLSHLVIGVDAASVDRVEVAAALAKAQRAVERVAVDLAGSHERADAVTGHPGEASDAASRSA